MSCHHRSSCPRVGHARRHTPHTVATSRVAEDVNLIRIHVEIGHAHLDELLIEAVKGTFAPHVPVVVGSAWRHIDTLGRAIEPLLVVPLLVVHGRMGVATAMQGYPQAASVSRFLAILPEPNGHGETIDFCLRVLPLLLVLLTFGGFPFLSQLLPIGFCFSTRQCLCRRA